MVAAVAVVDAVDWDHRQRDPRYLLWIGDHPCFQALCLDSDLDTGVDHLVQTMPFQQFPEADDACSGAAHVVVTVAVCWL